MQLTFIGGIYVLLSLCFFTIGSIFFFKRKARISNVYLSLILFLFGYTIFCRFLENSLLILLFPHFIETDFALFFLTPPLFLFFVQAFILKKKVSKEKMLLHFMPAFAAFLFLLPVFLMNSNEKFDYINEETISSFSWRYKILNTTFFIYSISYLSYILYLVKVYAKADSDENPVKKELSWVRFFTISLLFIQFCAVLLLILKSSNKKFEYLPGILTITFLIIIAKAIVNSDFIRNTANLATIVSKKKASYKGSVLNETDIKHFSERLKALMQHDRPYRKKELNIKMLAEMLSIPSYQLSQVINQNFNQNFFDFVNTYRIAEAKEKLISEEYDHLKVEAIGDKVGFRSRSSFFATFKKQTQLSPVEFKKQAINHK